MAKSIMQKGERLFMLNIIFNRWIRIFLTNTCTCQIRRKACKISLQVLQDVLLPCCITNSIFPNILVQIFWPVVASLPHIDPNFVRKKCYCVYLGLT